MSGEECAWSYDVASDKSTDGQEDTDCWPLNHKI